MSEYHSQWKRYILLNYFARKGGIRWTSFFFHLPSILESSKVLLAMPYLNCAEVRLVSQYTAYSLCLDFPHSQTSGLSPEYATYMCLITEAMKTSSVCSENLETVPMLTQLK